MDVAGIKYEIHQQYISPQYHSPRNQNKIATAIFWCYSGFWAARKKVYYGAHDTPKNRIE